ncbi:MAG TPA: hypothetical protein K8V56_10640 [Sporosarcina psychrophila]|uniref:Uncharacterized protein n=1 Tax=Sporosarcina psychrophila TaxID=1476 RepID=A0A921G082_SPOPS|nr:hypothetical protein [Sporosarcina psychrophila]
MQKKIKDLLPEWTTTVQDRSLTLTNDLDSLISCALLKHLFGYEINYFYTFNSIMVADKTDKRKSIGVDLALKSGYCYDNHLTMLTAKGYKNEDAANLNNVLNISNENYNLKYSFSTLMFLWSLYDVPLPVTDEGRITLLCIDSSYLGYYKHDGRYRQIFIDWMERLNMMELVEVLERYSFGEMEEFNRRHELKSTIFVNKRKGNKMDTTIRHSSPYMEQLDFEWISEHLGFLVELPTNQFEILGSFTNKEVEHWQMNDKTINESFSYAFTYKDKVKLSRLLREGESA